MAHKYKQNWPEKKKIEAVTTYLALGKIPYVAQVTGIPLDTLNYWKKLEWWKELIEQVRKDENQELDTKLGKIVNKSLDVVVDRLEHGEFSIDKFGKVHRVPVKLKDATKVSVDLLDKRSLLRKEPVQHVAEKQESINERLLSLAEQFAAIALGKNPTKIEKVIEGEVIIDAIHDQRPQGLQEGTFLGTQEETEEGEGSGNEEQGEGDDGEESRENGLERERRRTQNSGGPWWFESDVQSDGSGPGQEP